VRLLEKNKYRNVSKEDIRFTWPVVYNFSITVAALVILSDVIGKDKSALHVVGASVGLSAALVFLVISVVMFVLYMAGSDVLH
jgi:hypothetical protein